MSTRARDSRLPTFLDSRSQQTWTSYSRRDKIAQRSIDRVATPVAAKTRNWGTIWCRDRWACYADGDSWRGSERPRLRELVLRPTLASRVKKSRGIVNLFSRTSLAVLGFDFRGSSLSLELIRLHLHDLEASFPESSYLLRKKNARNLVQALCFPILRFFCFWKARDTWKPVRLWDTSRDESAEPGDTNVG